MQYPFKAVLVLIGLTLSAMGFVAAEAEEAAPEKQLFAVQIKVGPGWDPSIAPNEQKFFKEHSANLRALRDAGHIVMGARYSDIGLLVVSALSAEAVTALMQEDPSIAAGTFVFEVHPMLVFYPGTVASD